MSQRRIARDTPTVRFEVRRMRATLDARLRAYAERRHWTLLYAHDRVLERGLIEVEGEREGVSAGGQAEVEEEGQGQERLLTPPTGTGGSATRRPAPILRRDVVVCQLCREEIPREQMAAHQREVCP